MPRSDDWKMRVGFLPAVAMGFQTECRGDRWNVLRHHKFLADESAVFRIRS
jgi:hypothetical protein